MHAAGVAAVVVLLWCFGGGFFADCPYADIGEKARRRDIRQRYYSSQMCPAMEQVSSV